MARQKNMAHRRKARKESALERATARSKRTHQEQIKHLDRLFGEGSGAKKERARLTRLLEAPPKKAEKSSAQQTKKTRSQRRKEKAAKHQARQEKS